MPRRSYRKRPRRDLSPGIRGSVGQPRTLARYRREVVALLVVGHHMTGTRAVGLIKRWDRYLQAKWKMGRPPCNVADHLAKFDKAMKRHVSGDIHLPNGRKTFSRREFHSGMHKVQRKRGPGRSSRDAEHPKTGEIYETKAGARWEVTAVTDKRVTVKRAGTRPKNEGPFVWGRSSLKNLKEEKKSFFGNGPLFGDAVAPDPERRRGRAGRGTLARKASGRKRGKGYTRPHLCRAGAAVQTLVFDRRSWTLAKAKAWAKAHGYVTHKQDVTPKSIRLRQKSPVSFKVVGSIPFRKGLVAVLGCPAGAFTRRRVMKKGKRNKR